MQSALLKLFFFILFLSPFFLQGQSDQVKVLEEKIKTESKASYIRSANALASLYMQDKDYDQGVKWLKNAIKEAKKSRSPEQIAIVNKEAAVLILQYAPNEKKYLQEAYNALTTSLDKEVASIESENINLLRQLKSRSTNEKLSNQIDETLVAINAMKDKEKLNEFKKRDDDIVYYEYNQLTEEREKLESAVDKLSEQRRQLSVVYQKSGEQIKQTTQDLNRAKISLDSAKIINDSLLLANLQALYDKQKQAIVLQNERLEKQQLAVESQQKTAQRNYMLAAAILVFLVSLFLYMRYQSSQKQNSALEAKNEIIELEKGKSDQLLLNILPSKIADELKENGKVKTQYFESATVLFADFQKFSKIAASVSPEKLIGDLDYCFSKFDEIVGTYGIEKIKTIGDAYMCVSGVPNPIRDHASRMVEAAKEMQAFLEIWNASRKEDGLPEFKSRIGIHSGPLIAGVVGTAKFAYDIWGDTVNIADRMQDSGEAGEINISKATQEMLNGAYKLKYRGKLQVKNMSDMDGYFVQV